jgi:REP element-mobilizing transposase RayT
MKNIYVEFSYESFYHVFNRTNNSDLLFREPNNRLYFIKLMREKLEGFVNIYAFSLLSNHFHLSISIPNKEAFDEKVNSVMKQNKTKAMQEYLNGHCLEHKLIANQFSGLFNSYSQAFNKKYNRHGNLFNRPFKRAILKSENDFGLNIYYIHHNARKHGLVNDFKEHRWNSYYDLINSDDTFLKRDFVINYFGSKELFIDFHNKKYLEKDFKHIWLE